MHIEAFAELLSRQRLTHGAGVPCSFFTSLVSHAATAPGFRYVSATSEGEAVAIAAGMLAAGQPAFALMQNSGLGNAVNPITSLLDVYQIPVALLVSHRGQPGLDDEPQHQRMGQITHALAQLCGLRTHDFVAERFAAELSAQQADAVPAAWIVKKHAFEGPSELPPRSFQVRSDSCTPASTGSFSASCTREAALACLLPELNRGLSGAADSSCAPAVIATTGKLSRELWELDDRAGDKRNRFYMVGSMGCAAGFGLGITQAQPQRNVIVLDGDGALLMKLGSLATIGYCAPTGLHHVVFDNGAHDSTGGQPTPSAAVDFAVASLACGYRHASTVDSAEQLRKTFAAQLQLRGPTLLRMLVTTGSRAQLGRPSLSPRAGYQRFQSFLSETAPAADGGTATGVA